MDVDRLEASVDVDASKAIAELEAFKVATESAAKDHTANIDVDTGKAEAELVAFDVVLDETTRDRTIHVNVDKSDVDHALKLISLVESGAAGMGGGGGGGGGFGAATSGGGAFATMLGTIGAAIVGMVPTMTMWIGLISVLPGALAAAAAGVGILVAALAPLLGLLGAIPVALGAFGMAIGTVMAALGPVIAGVTAYKQATAGAAQTTQDLAAKQHALVLANEGVANSVHSLQQAEQSLADARKQMKAAPAQAEEELRQAHFGAAQAAINEKQAVQALIDAQKNLQQAQAATSDSMVSTTKQTDYFTGKVYEVAIASKQGVDQAKNEASARLQVRQAELNLKEARDSNRQAQSKLNDMEQKGIKGSDVMVAARRNLAQAEWSVKQAHQGVANAEYNRAQAIKALHDQMTGATGATNAWTQAQKKLSDEGKQFVQFLVDDFLPVFDQISKAAQDALLPGVEAGLKDVLKLVPLFKREVTTTGHILGGSFQRLMDYWTRPKQQHTLADMFKGLNGVLRIGMRFLLPMSRIFVAITRAATPMVRILSKDLLKSLNDLADWMETDHGKKTMTDFFTNAAHITEDWVGVLKPIAGMIGAIARAGAPLAGPWLTNLGDTLQKVSDWMNSDHGQKTIFNYMVENQPVLGEVASTLGDIVKAILNPSLGGTDSSFYKFVHAIHHDLLPDLITIWNKLDKSGFAGTIISTLGPVARALSHIIDSLGPAVRGAAWAVKLMAEGIAKIPKPILTALEGMLLAYAATKGVKKLFGIGGDGGGGLVKNLLGKVLPSIFGESGKTPLKPLYVFVVNEGFGGGPGGVGGKKGWLKRLFGWGAPEAEAGAGGAAAMTGASGLGIAAGGTFGIAAMAAATYLVLKHIAGPDIKNWGLHSPGMPNMNPALGGDPRGRGGPHLPVTSPAATGHPANQGEYVWNPATQAYDWVPWNTKTVTHLDAVKQHAADASRQIDLIGPHAKNSFDEASKHLDTFAGKWQNIHDKTIALRLRGITEAENRIRNLEAIHLSDKTMNIDLSATGMGRHMSGSQLADLISQGGTRAAGGPVSQGRLYLVGEKGPELFRPAQSGTISNARETSQMMGEQKHIEINQTFNEKVDPKHVAAELAWELAG